MKMRISLIVLMLCGMAWAGDVEGPDGAVVGMTLEESIAEAATATNVHICDKAGRCPHAAIPDGFNETDEEFHARMQQIGVETIALYAPRIAVCDTRRELAEYPKAMSAKISLDELTKKIQKARQTVRGLTATIKAKQVLLDEMKVGRKKYPKAFEELTTLKAQLLIFQQTRGRELDGQQKTIRAVMVTAEEDVKTAITRIAKEKGVSLVITKTPSQTGPVVLYADDSLDITDAVLEELNKKDE